MMKQLVTAGVLACFWSSLALAGFNLHGSVTPPLATLSFGSNQPINGSTWTPAQFTGNAAQQGTQNTSVGLTNSSGAALFTDSGNHYSAGAVLQAAGTLTGTGLYSNQFYYVESPGVGGAYTYELNNCAGGGCTSQQAVTGGSVSGGGPYTVTLTFGTGYVPPVGTVVTLSGLTSTGAVWNGTQTITASAAGSISFSSASNGPYNGYGYITIPQITVPYVASGTVTLEQAGYTEDAIGVWDFVPYSLATGTFPICVDATHISALSPSLPVKEVFFAGDNGSVVGVVNLTTGPSGQKEYCVNGVASSMNDYVHEVQALIVPWAGRPRWLRSSHAFGTPAGTPLASFTASNPVINHQAHGGLVAKELVIAGSTDATLVNGNYCQSLTGWSVQTYELVPYLTGCGTVTTNSVTQAGGAATPVTANWASPSWTIPAGSAVTVSGGGITGSYTVSSSTATSITFSVSGTYTSGNLALTFPPFTPTSDSTGAETMHWFGTGQGEANNDLFPVPSQSLLFYTNFNNTIWSPVEFADTNSSSACSMAAAGLAACAAVRYRMRWEQVIPSNATLAQTIAQTTSGSTCTTFSRTNNSSGSGVFYQLKEPILYGGASGSHFVNGSTYFIQALAFGGANKLTLSDTPNGACIYDTGVSGTAVLYADTSNVTLYTYCSNADCLTNPQSEAFVMNNGGFQRYNRFGWLNILPYNQGTYIGTGSALGGLKTERVHLAVNIFAALYKFTLWGTTNTAGNTTINFDATTGGGAGNGVQIVNVPSDPNNCVPFTTGQYGTNHSTVKTANVTYNGGVSPGTMTLAVVNGAPGGSGNNKLMNDCPNNNAGTNTGAGANFYATYFQEIQASMWWFDHMSMTGGSPADEDVFVTVEPFWLTNVSARNWLAPILPAVFARNVDVQDIDGACFNNVMVVLNSECAFGTWSIDNNPAGYSASASNPSVGSATWTLTSGALPPQIGYGWIVYASSSACINAGGAANQSYVTSYNLFAGTFTLGNAGSASTTTTCTFLFYDGVHTDGVFINGTSFTGADDFMVDGLLTSGGTIPAAGTTGGAFGPIFFNQQGATNGSFGDYAIINSKPGNANPTGATGPQQIGNPVFHFEAPSQNYVMQGNDFTPSPPTGASGPGGFLFDTNAPGNSLNIYPGTANVPNACPYLLFTSGTYTGGNTEVFGPSTGC